MAGHRLKTVKLGGRRYVLAQDLDQFLAAINGQAVGAEADMRAFDRRVEAAEHELDRRGISNGGGSRHAKR